MEQLTPKFDDYSLRTYRFTLPQLMFSIEQDLAEEHQPFSQVFDHSQEDIDRVMTAYTEWSFKIFNERWQGEGRSGALIFMRLLMEHWICNKDVSDSDKEILMSQILYSYSVWILEEADHALVKSTEEELGLGEEDDYLDDFDDYEDEDEY